MADKKFCVLINSLTEGGAEKAVATLMPEYQKQGADVPLVCLEKNDVHKINATGINYLSNQTGSGEGAIRKFVSLFIFAHKLKRYIRANGICLVQSHIYRANYVNVLARLMGSVHKAQLVNHGIPQQYGEGGITGRINQTLIRWLYPRADQVICPSIEMMYSLQQMGVVKEKLRHITNPVDLVDIEKQSAAPVDAELFEFQPDKKYLITIGRLERVKRTGDIIDAFSNIAGSRPEVELMYVVKAYGTA